MNRGGYQRKNSCQMKGKGFSSSQNSEMLAMRHLGPIFTPGNKKSARYYFSPNAYKPNEDVKWWMPIPTDGWNDIKSVTPTEGDITLTMGMYGKIFSGVWRKPCGATSPMFMPYVWDVLFWRSMPPLPPGVNLM